MYVAEQATLHRRVALKYLRAEFAHDAGTRARFLREAQTIAQLNHPHVVGIYDVGETATGELFLAMELIDGQPLRALCNNGPLPIAVALRIARQLTLALGAAHDAGIVHRDIKPDNVMIQTRDEDGYFVRVLDFGIAATRAAHATRLTQTGALLGTPAYMAPEQISGLGVDARTDIYALGCVLFEMLTGHVPFESDSLVATITKHLHEEPAAPSLRRGDLASVAGLDELVLSMLRKAPDQRPQRMSELREAIDLVYSAIFVTATIKPTTEQASRERVRSQPAKPTAHDPARLAEGTAADAPVGQPRIPAAPQLSPAKENATATSVAPPHRFRRFMWFSIASVSSALGIAAFAAWDNRQTTKPPAAKAMLVDQGNVVEDTDPPDSDHDKSVGEVPPKTAAAAATEPAAARESSGASTREHCVTYPAAADLRELPDVARPQNLIYYDESTPTIVGFGPLAIVNGKRETVAHWLEHDGPLRASSEVTVTVLGQQRTAQQFRLKPKGSSVELTTTATQFDCDGAPYAAAFAVPTAEAGSREATQRMQTFFASLQRNADQ